MLNLGILSRQRNVLPPSENWEVTSSYGYELIFQKQALWTSSFTPPTLPYT